VEKYQSEKLGFANVKTGEQVTGVVSMATARKLPTSCIHVEMCLHAIQMERKNKFLL
jgi:hypothetical protein